MKWRGIGKVIEETSEACQILGKLIAFPSGIYPNEPRNLREKLIEEVADSMAALDYFCGQNFTPDEIRQINARRTRKFNMFTQWGLSGILEEDANERSYKE